MKKIVVSLFSAIVFSMSLIAENLLLVVPANVTLVNLGFSLMRMMPNDDIGLACYTGDKEVDTIELFDRSSQRWVAVERAKWNSGEFKRADANTVVLVGDSLASQSLGESASWANNILTPSGHAYHEVVNAFHSINPLSAKQWKSLEAKYGIRLRDVTVKTSRYDAANGQVSRAAIAEEKKALEAKAAAEKKALEEKAKLEAAAKEAALKAEAEKKALEAKAAAEKKALEEKAKLEAAAKEAALKAEAEKKALEAKAAAEKKALEEKAKLEAAAKEAALKAEAEKKALEAKAAAEKKALEEKAKLEAAAKDAALKAEAEKKALEAKAAAEKKDLSLVPTEIIVTPVAAERAKKMEEKTTIQDALKKASSEVNNQEVATSKAKPISPVVEPIAPPVVTPKVPDLPVSVIEPTPVSK